MMKHPHWDYIQKAWEKNRIPQAMLFADPMYAGSYKFAVQLSKLLLCKTNTICGICPDCLMVDRLEHPDMEWVKPEKKNGPIKIDQIRQLQQEAYLTSQRARYNIILIEQADKMNTASANALLKILEEPARHTIFVLLAEQISTILPTILSRCHVFPCSIPYSVSDLLNSSNLQDSDKKLVIQQEKNILDGLIALLEHQEHPCALAANCSHFELNAFLWFLYLILSQLLEASYVPSKLQLTEYPQLIKIGTLLNPTILCKQLDKIITILKKLSHTMNSNQTLVLEDLLIGFL